MKTRNKLVGHWLTCVSFSIQMNASLTYTLLVLLAFFAVLSICDADGTLPSPPERPKNFESEEQLENYLKSLKRYYTIVSRPRCVWGITIKTCLFIWNTLLHSDVSSWDKERDSLIFRVFGSRLTDPGFNSHAMMSTHCENERLA